MHIFISVFLSDFWPLTLSYCFLHEWLCMCRMCLLPVQLSNRVSSGLSDINGWLVLMKQLPPAGKYGLSGKTLLQTFFIPLECNIPGATSSVTKDQKRGRRDKWSSRGNQKFFMAEDIEDMDHNKCVSERTGTQIKSKCRI